ncbi:MAG: hypothetical protein ACYSTL_01430 [Planctomycetota bacterium]
MKNGQDIAIGLLAITAVVLGAMLVASFTSAKPAYAAAPLKGGDYILGTGAVTSSRDLTYVVDIATKQLNVYSANTNNNTLDIVDTVDLERAFRQ